MSSMPPVKVPLMVLGVMVKALIALDPVADTKVYVAPATGKVGPMVPTNTTFIVPIVALVGIFTIGLIGGSVLTEEVFARPGLGKLMVGATTRRDYNLLQAIMVVYALIIVAVNILVDIIYTWIDPRVQR